MKCFFDKYLGKISIKRTCRTNLSLEKTILNYLAKTSQVELCTIVVQRFVTFLPYFTNQPSVKSEKINFYRLFLHRLTEPTTVRIPLPMCHFLLVFQKRRNPLKL